MTRHAPVVVVGGGIAGLCLTAALARRRVPVVLCEGGRIGAQGASSVPAALLNPHRGRSARADPADRRGLEAMHRLLARLEARGLDTGAVTAGVLRPAPNAARAARWRRHPDTRWLEPNQVPAPYRAPHGALLVPDGGWLRPSLLLPALARAATEDGAEIREGVRVRAIAPGPRIDTDAGGLDARHVVLCVGADRTPALPVPALRRVAGEVVTLRWPETPAWPIAGGVYAAFGQGWAWVGGNHRDPDTPDPSAPASLARSLSWALPGADVAPVEAVWSGVRARGATPRPDLREVGDGVSFLGAMAGRGFLCAADLAGTLADRLAAA